MATIIKDLPELVEHNVISVQTAADIEKYYATRVEPQSNVMLTIFGILGGVLAGLGIILIFAHNWDTFSKTVKTVLAVLPLFVAQGLAGYSILANKSRVWKEASAMLLFFAIGSSISLVAQVYNISGDFPAFLRAWIVLGLPLVYVLNSNAAAILLLSFTTWYSVQMGFTSGQPYLAVLFIGALMPYYIKVLREDRNSNMAFTLNWLVPLTAFEVVGAAVNSADGFMLVIFMAFFGLLYIIGSLPFFKDLKRRTGYISFGGLGIIIILLMVSTKSMWIEIVGSMDNGYHTPQPLFIAIWAVLLLAGAVLMFKYKSANFNTGLKWATFLFPVLYAVAMANVVVATILTNLLILAFGIIIIRNGINKLDFRTLNFGLSVIAALTVIRFFDTNVSFVIRGSLFLIVGIGFFVTNLIVVKRKKENPNNPTHEN